MRPLSLQEIMTATGAVLHQGSKDLEVTDIVADSRVIFGKHPIFWALRTESGDGHKHTYEAIVAGAIAVMVDESALHEVEVRDDVALLSVPSTWQALRDLASYRRNLWHAPVVAITGSNGKTAVKEYIAHLLQDDQFYRSPRSYNSQLGVPLSAIQAPARASLRALEVGVSQLGDMAVHAQWLKPQFGVMTHFGAAHDIGFESRQAKLKSKLSLFQGAEWIVVDATQEEVVEAAASVAPLRTFSADPNTHADIQFHITHHEGQATLSWTMGDHQGESIWHIHEPAAIQNALTAIAFVLAWQEHVQTVYIEDMHHVGQRMTQVPGRYGHIILNDTYSMDDDSLQVAMSAMNQAPKKLARRAILAMPEQMDWDESLPVDIFQIHSDRDVEFLIREQPWRHWPPSIILIKGHRKARLERLLPFLVAQVHDTVISIDHDAMASNIRWFRAHLPERTQLMAMVKADAYGLGAIALAETMAKHHVGKLGVAYVEEGVRLREAGVELPIVVMNPGNRSVDLLQRFHLEPTVYSLQSLRRMAWDIQHYHTQIKEFTIHIEWDTGMHRLGFHPEDLKEILNCLTMFPFLRVGSSFTHLAAAELPEEEDYSHDQVEKFKAVHNELQEALGYSIERHVSNSAWAIRHPEDGMDMVRLGIALYGESGIEDQPMEPVVHWQTEVSQIRNLQAGDTVSYGRQFKAQRATVVATLPVGYADGYPRILGRGNAFVIIQGHRCPVIGNVCMDTMMVDATEVPHLAAGQKVELLGHNILLRDMAQWADTIPYEILTGLSQRLPRTSWSPES